MKQCQALFEQASRIGKSAWHFFVVVAWLAGAAAAMAGQRPSLFRGVVVADSPLGVRVVSVEDASQASQADLRPEDIIIRVDGADVGSIDAFAMFSEALKGRAARRKSHTRSGRA